MQATLHIYIYIYIYAYVYIDVHIFGLSDMCNMYTRTFHAVIWLSNACCLLCGGSQSRWLIFGSLSLLPRLCIHVPLLIHGCITYIHTYIYIYMYICIHPKRELPNKVKYIAFWSLPVTIWISEWFRRTPKSPQRNTLPEALLLPLPPPPEDPFSNTHWPCSEYPFWKLKCVLVYIYIYAYTIYYIYQLSNLSAPGHFWGARGHHL